MNTEKYDVVILGGGNAGMGVTVATRAAGLSVAMIEARDLGGTCPNRGCTPKKVLVAAAHALHEIERAAEHRTAVAKPKLDWAALIGREQAMIAGIPDRLAGVMSRRGVDVIFGMATFVDSHTVKVGGRRLEAANIVIATGSKPRPLAFAGAEHMVTSDEVLCDPTLPDEVVFVGGGVISFELGHVYARAGARVTVIEVLPQLLGDVDADAVERICGESRRIGMRLLTLAQVKRIDRVDGRLSVVFAKDGIDHAITADRVVNCAGRTANVASLDLDAGKVSHREGRLDVDAFLRSRSNPDVYPDDAWQAALCDEVMDAVEEIATRVWSTMPLPPADQKAQRESLAAGPLSHSLERLQHRLVAHGAQYFADGRLTVADLKVFVWIGHLRSGQLDHVPVDLPDRVAPRLVEHYQRVKQHPAIKAYYAERKVAI